MRSNLLARLRRLEQYQRKLGSDILAVITGLASVDDLNDADRVTLALMFPDGLGNLYQREECADEIEQLIAKAATQSDT
jgi:hypothetical protein